MIAVNMTIKREPCMQPTSTCVICWGRIPRSKKNSLHFQTVPDTVGTDLQDDPHVYNQVAAHVNSRPPIDIADLVDERQAFDPRLAGRDAEHGDKGQVEAAEAVRHELLEERHAQDGVWAWGGRGREGATA